LQHRKGGQRAIGFIAEDVAKVIPEVVAMEEDGENARGVNYGHLVALTVEGIKEQQARLERQQDEIDSLRNENAGLHERLAKLESLVESLAKAETTNRKSDGL
jgi:predicted nuclease with TOPRIM domain